MLTALWNCANRIRFFCGGCKAGKSLVTNGLIRVRNRGKLTIGNHVRINSGVMANPIGGSPCTILTVQPGAKLEIGDGAGLSNCAIFASESISIGRDVLIGAGAKIYDTDFHPVSFEARKAGAAPKHSPIVIEDGAFIGAQSIILKGVRIGQRSVIGAGSVVTKAVPGGEVWAGNPAKFIRRVDD